jgi:hypothetical protein
MGLRLAPGEKKTKMTDDPSHTPIQNPKRNPLTSWAFVAALLGAGAMPCPDCGMPLAGTFGRWPCY